MPAETHTLREGIDASDVMDLIDALVGAGDDELRPDTALDAIGLDDELDLLHLCGAVVEEFAERTVAELDVEELLLARTVGELAEVIVRAFEVSDQPDLPPRP